jgi:hypothetical protein
VCGADVSSGASPVLNNDGGIPARRETLRDKAGHNVRYAARREGYDKRDPPVAWEVCGLRSGLHRWGYGRAD